MAAFQDFLIFDRPDYVKLQVWLPRDLDESTKHVEKVGLGKAESSILSTVLYLLMMYQSVLCAVETLRGRRFSARAKYSIIFLWGSRCLEDISTSPSCSVSAGVSNDRLEQFFMNYLRK